MSLLRRFWGDRRGNVAVIFAIAIVPVVGAVGAAVDYSRAGSVRASLQGAVDATALALSKQAVDLTNAQFQQMGQDFFHGVFNHPAAHVQSVVPTFSDKDGTFTVRVSAEATIQTVIARLLGKDQLVIGAKSEVVWGMKRLEVALVLDNTTSMASQSRMVELKKAAKSLLDTLKKAAKKPEDVKVAIIPYGTEVKISGFANTSTAWLDWSSWEAAPAVMAGWISNNQSVWDRTGPGTSCPFSTSAHGFGCTNGPASSSNDSTTGSSWTIPTSGSNAGLICPSRDNGSKSTTATGVLTDVYHNGCYNSTLKSNESDWYPVVTGSSASCGSVSSSDCLCTGSGSNKVCAIRPGARNWESVAKGSSMSCGSLSESNPQVCKCSGSGSNKVCRQKAYTHTWVSNARSTWNGCVRDRTQDNDIKDTTPTSSASTKFQPHQARNCEGSAALAAALPLTNDWDTLGSRIEAMNTGSGTSGTRYTNITIGLAWGWHALFNNQPMTQAEAPKDDLDKVIILMTDGDNTQNRWNKFNADNGAIDDRTELACQNAKAAGVKVYTVRLMDGNEELLKDCATSLNMYYNVATATQLNAAFAAIAQNLANLRIAK